MFAMHWGTMNRYMAKKQTRADQWLHAYHHDWKGSVHPLFKEAIIPTFDVTI